MTTATAASPRPDLAATHAVAIDGAAAPLLRVRGLKTYFETRQGLVKAVDGVDLEVHPGECLGVVGESGSGKSVTFASVMGLVRRPGFIAGGTIEFAGRDLTRLDERAKRRLRGKDIAMTMQDALTALNPAFTVGTQIVEVLRAHGEAGGRAGAGTGRPGSGRSS